MILSFNFHQVLSAIYICLVTIPLFCFIQYLWKKHQLNKLSSKLPGPKGWPIIGNGLDFVSTPTGFYNYLMKMGDTYPDLVKGSLGPSLVYLVSKPEYLEKIMTSQKALTKMYPYHVVTPAVGFGIFSAPVPLWKRNRRIISHAFNHHILESFVEIFVKQSTTMGSQLEKHVGKGEFDLNRAVTKCTMDITCETLMGIEVNAQTTDAPILHWVGELMEIAITRMFVVWYHFDFIYKWTQLAKKQLSLLKNFHSFTQNIVRQKKIGFEQNNITSSKRKAFLDLLIEQSVGENKLTDQQLFDEVNTFIIASSDTTATASGFLFVMVGMHPEIQDRVYDEVESVLGTDRDVEARDLPQLKEQVIKETLRLFGPGPYIGRELEDDVHLENDLVLPKGSSVILILMHVHRNKKFWPDPLKFDPDRFLPEEVAKRHPYSYVPFSGGPRNCIAAKMAMMALKSMVATIVRKYQISTSYKRVEDIELTSHIVLRPIHGYKISLQLRNNVNK